MSDSRNKSPARRRMSRKRRRQIIMRRRIAAAVIAVSLLALIVTGTVLAIKAVSGGGQAGTQSNALNSNVLNGNKSDNDISGGSAEDGKDAESRPADGDPDKPNGGEDTSAGKQPDEPVNAGVSDGDSKTFITSKGFKGYVKDGVTYIDGFLIVNKTYSLPSDYIPQDTEVPVTSEWSTKSLNRELMQAWRQLQSAASAQGLNIYISSGYRSYSTQKNLYNNYVQKDGREEADTYSARAGHSEHQTGICFDLNTIDDSFQYTDEGIWVNDNAYRYGFIIRYPKGKEHLTGYQYESWHLRYVGLEMAEKLYNNGDWITMEEYFGIDSRYAD